MLNVASWKLSGARRRAAGAAPADEAALGPDCTVGDADAAGADGSASAGPRVPPTTRAVTAATRRRLEWEEGLLVRGIPATVATDPGPLADLVRRAVRRCAGERQGRSSDSGFAGSEFPGCWFTVP